MGTHCMIGKLNKDGSADMIYCHYDGYPEYTGTVLRYYYNRSNIDKLLALGDLSKLGTIPESDPKNWDMLHTKNYVGNCYEVYCTAYRDRGEKNVAAKHYKSIGAAIDKFNFCDYLYLIDEHGQWLRIEKF